MDEKTTGNLGIIGLNSLQVAESAQRAGFNVFLVDYYRDSDIEIKNHFPMQKYSNPNLSEEYSAEKLVNFAIEKLDGMVDKVILTSAVGCNPEVIKKIENRFHIIGNNSRNVRGARDWRKLKKIAEDLDVNFPRTYTVNSKTRLEKLLRIFEFPVILKPIFEAGDFEINFDDINKINNNIVLKSEEDLDKIKEIKGEILLQEFIDGIPISCSILSTGYESTALTVNRQLMGEDGLYAKGYCGNIVPFKTKEEDKIKRISENIILSLNLMGSNGIDFILRNNELYILEINTRLQDTLWGIEKRLGINLVKEHINAVDGKIDFDTDESNLIYGKGILFANKLLVIKKKINLSGIRNIPENGSIIQKNEPVCSIYSYGKSETDILNRIYRTANTIKTLYTTPYSNMS